MMESEIKPPCIRMSDGQRRSLNALLQAEVITALRLNRENANAGASSKRNSNKYPVSDVSLLQKEPIHSNDYRRLIFKIVDFNL